MWLPKRERNLLATYALSAEADSRACEISDNELVKSLQLRDLRELYMLKTRLKRRDLLKFSTVNSSIKDVQDSPELYEQAQPNTFLTEQGLLIGQKYCTNIGTFELWSRANLWFWLFAAIILCVTALLIAIFMPW